MIKLTDPFHIVGILPEGSKGFDSYAHNGHIITADSVADIATQMMLPENKDIKVTYAEESIGLAIEEYLMYEGIEGFCCYDGVIYKPSEYFMRLCLSLKMI